MDGNRTVPFGDFDLKLKLAHGGMAEVFLGVKREDGPDAPDVVIKRILPELGSDPRFLAMFINEAQLAAQMDHPNVVRVLDFGEHDGRAYMVMEYVDGLDCWRFTRRLFPWGDKHEALAAWMTVQVCAGLEYTHGLTDVNGKPLHAVHRDLSPSNIYLSREGEVKLGDFGIALIDSPRYHAVEIIPKGKFGYMAPEQVEGRKVDHRADVYSAGVVLCELLIGRKLFTGNSQLSIMLDIRDGRLEALEQNAGKISPALLDILSGALAKKPADRFSSARDLGDSLTAFLETSGTSVTPEDLGRQVTRAVELRDPRSSAPAESERTPLTAEQAVLELQDMSSATHEFTPLDREPSGATPITSENTEIGGQGRYLARIADGLTIGPTSYAHIIELIYSDRIGPQTLVSVDGHNYSPTAEVPELARHLPAYTPTCDVDDVSSPDRRGFLEIEVPSEVLLSLATKQESGLFVCQLAARRKEVYLRKGRPVYVGSNDSGELLGEFLVRNDIIERMELEMALALLPKFNGHLGDTLIALGMLSAVELFKHINNQLRTRMEDLLSWRTGTYEFYHGVSCRQGVLEIDLDPFDFVREKILNEVQQIDADQILDEMSTTMIAPSGILKELCPLMRLPSEIEEKIISIDDWITVRDLTELSTKSRVVLARAIYVALEAGLWSFDGPPPSWRNPETRPGE